MIDDDESPLHLHHPPTICTHPFHGAHEIKYINVANRNPRGGEAKTPLQLHIQQSTTNLINRIELSLAELSYTNGGDGTKRRWRWRRNYKSWLADDDSLNSAKYFVAARAYRANVGSTWDAFFGSRMTVVSCSNCFHILILVVLIVAGRCCSCFCFFQA